MSNLSAVPEQDLVHDHETINAACMRYCVEDVDDGSWRASAHIDGLVRGAGGWELGLPRHHEAAAARTNGMNLRTVSIPGFVVVPARMFHSVMNGTPESSTNLCICACPRPRSVACTSSMRGIVEFMGRHPTGFGGGMQPHSVAIHDYRIWMRPDTKVTLWENVAALMRREFGEENVTRFAAWAKIGVGSVLRIREQKTSIGLKIVEKIAKKAHLDPWQLLVPGLDVDNPPVLARDAERARTLIANIRSSHEAMSGLLPPADTEPGALIDPKVIELPGASTPAKPGLQKTSAQKRRRLTPNKKGRGA